MSKQLFLGPEWMPHYLFRSASFLFPIRCPFKKVFMKLFQKELQWIVTKAKLTNLTFASFQGYSDVGESPPSLKESRYDIWHSPESFRHTFSLRVYAAQLQWRLIIFIGKNLWRWMLAANKKASSLKKILLEYRFCLSNLEKHQ